MTWYHGGKQRIGKKLSEIIVEASYDISNEENLTIKGYCEPFCGMLGVYRHIPKQLENKFEKKLTYKAGDVNKSVIMMWKDVQKGWTENWSWTFTPGILLLRRSSTKFHNLQPTTYGSKGGGGLRMETNGRSAAPSFSDPTLWLGVPVASSRLSTPPSLEKGSTPVSSVGFPVPWGAKTEKL